MKIFEKLKGLEALKDDRVVPVLLLLVFLPLLAVLAIMLMLIFPIFKFLNYFTTRFFKWGNYSNELLAGHAANITELFASLCRQEQVSGLVTVTSKQVLGCGCQESTGYKETMSATQAREHLSSIASLRRGHSYSESKIEFYTFKTKTGSCEIAYPLIVYNPLASAEFPSIPLYSFNDSGLSFAYHGHESEFKVLVSAAQESVKKGGCHEEIS